MNNFLQTRDRGRLLLGCGAALALLYFYRAGVWQEGGPCHCEPPAAVEPLWNRTLNFDALGFTNETGSPTGEYLVPNFVHFIHFGGHPLSYVHMLCTLSAFKNQRPERLYMHYDDNNTFTGKYWEAVYNTPGVRDVLVFNRVEVPKEIFGQKLNEGWLHYHGGDVMRIRTVMRYGGIYLDNDVYVIRSLDDFRRFEFTIGWEDNTILGDQVLIGHKDARFLPRYLDCYRQYDPNSFYYNAGEKPTADVLEKAPHIVHRAKSEFATDFKYMYLMFEERMDEAKLHTFYIFHLLTRWLHLVKSLSPTATYPVDFDEINVVRYPVTFRDLAFAMYDVAGVDWPRGEVEGATQ